LDNTELGVEDMPKRKPEPSKIISHCIEKECRDRRTLRKRLKNNSQKEKDMLVVVVVVETMTQTSSKESPVKESFQTIYLPPTLEDSRPLPWESDFSTDDDRIRCRPLYETAWKIISDPQCILCPLMMKNQLFTFGIFNVDDLLEVGREELETIVRLLKQNFEVTFRSVLYL
jgi:hypothetical protein